ncbi:MAG: response regulator [Geobacter sp.]|nr:response regulator [Geobacter sp.]
MDKIGQNYPSCVLSENVSEDCAYDQYLSNPLARCAGKPPVESLLLHSLCLDCDLLHKHGDRKHFAKIASSLADSHSGSVKSSTALDIDCMAIKEMLERLSIGDPDARLILREDSERLRQLVPLMNHVADFMKDLIEESHETAIGLCEHYGTLLAQAGGDPDACASIDSPIELIAKLGELINSQSKTFRDVITRQKDQEHQLQSINQQLQAIIDFLPDATFVVDAEHNVIAWNKAIEMMTGVTKESVLGKGDYVYSMSLYGLRRPALIDFIGSDEGLPEYNYVHIKRQGNTIIAESFLPAIGDFEGRHIWIAASPLLNLEGQQIGAIESIRDISDYKKVERERELLQLQLHHAQKLDSIGKLAGGIAHEFNNILAAIIGYASILEKRLGVDSPHQTAIRHIINSSEKAASLTRDMLTFSRKQVMSPETFDLNTLISDMMEMLCRLAGENIQVEFDPGEQNMLLFADYGQLQQVILNLYNNAKDAMPRGGRLSITTRRSNCKGQEPDVPPNIPPGSYLLLTISDTGSGIDPGLVERVFDPFFTTKEVGKGTGLGLSIVFGIIQQHKGHITVTSKPGEGTVFSIWLPEFEGSQPKVEEQAVCTWRQNRGSETILVGEDNEDLRRMVVELLQDVGYQVVEARDGAEVISAMKISGETIDLLLLDVIMPGMNGYEALMEVRNQHPKIPCIFLSGYSNDILQQNGSLPGSFEHLSKPIPPDRLIAAVRSALGGHLA